ncbi:ABC transporter substrate-binding protein [Loigolactobacillus binensis]|uniref:ABC transporter substrate-binding protein n=1 Tax=Loigolactobacillus binensis TaxID=2559922 RepID=A0ABW3EBN4_9LACO|nr:ABC transporter substrate-binding protein [Loigolactobacillus binensis]
MITITDQAGDIVTVPQEIKRIVVAGILPLPSILATCFNAAEKVVGMPVASLTAAKHGLLAAAYPALLNANTAFDQAGEVDIDKLAALAPDVVFYAARNQAQKRQLQAAGIPAVGFSVSHWQYNAIATLKGWLDLLAQLLPPAPKAKQVIDYSNQVYQRIRQQSALIPAAKRQKVFFLFRYDQAGITTSSGQFFGQYWADSVGATNVGAALSNDNSTPVSFEQVRQWNPQQILITNFTAAQPTDLYHNTLGNEDWQQLAAVQQQQVHKMPLGMYRSYSPEVDTPITLLWLAKTIYPDQFSALDLDQEAKAYYQTVFNLELTDQQVAKMFTPPAAASAY